METPLQFLFVFGWDGVRRELKVPLRLPLVEDVNDLATRLISHHKIPCFLEQRLHDELREFVGKESQRIQDELDGAAVEKIRSGEVPVKDIVESWTKAYSQEVVEYAKPETLTNEHVFSEVYHTLIHSPALETLLNLEHTYALAIADILDQRDADMDELEKRQSNDMELAVRSLGSGYDADYVNQLAQHHFDNTQLLESKWASELSNLQDTQKREYREWVMKVHEDTQTSPGAPTYIQRVRALSTTMPTENVSSENPHAHRMEESFTIHLGAQLKTTHNIRLISTDVLDLCWHKSNQIGGMIVPQPQRLQTAMSLYSNNLCGLVLLVDNRLNSYSGIKRDFARVCQQSTDFHFPDLEQQFSQLELEVEKGNTLRNKKNDRDANSSTLSMSEEEEQMLRLKSGDFYVTRHSNLAEAHVVFHLVCDDSLKSSDVTSRHPVILGYRNVLKACFRHDISTISLPLLLVHEMSEEMTIPWCMRRAELVYKCVKGFMMELATWSGQESRTIQFLVPRSLSEETFASLSNMLPSIFRMSNPVIAKK